MKEGTEELKLGDNTAGKRLVDVLRHRTKKRALYFVNILSSLSIKQHKYL